jgi:mono/diheme cytochrome c family protein
MLRGLLSCCAFSIFIGSPAFAADVDNGRALADRWCATCHVVGHEQKSATDQAPPFATIARTPNFDANVLAFLLLKPHPSMPKLELSRVEALDLAGYVATLK